jgi:hypothetical protein
MNGLRRRHGRRTPHGLEIKILRRLPGITLVGSTLLVTLSALVRLLPPDPGIDHAKHIMSVDIFSIAAGITFVTAVFTVAIGCTVVHVMKGPAYVADSYPVEHAERPSIRGRSNRG